MSGDSNGVVVYRTTRLSMIEAVRSAHPAPAGRLRRNKRLSHAELADAILATLPEAEPDPLKAVEAAERIIAARDAEIELMRRDFRSAEKLIGERDAEITRKNGRCDDLFATARAKEATITELRQEAKTSEALIETLRAELAEAGEETGALQAELAAADRAAAASRERADGCAAELARVAEALGPLAKGSGMPIAERARRSAQLRDSVTPPAAPAEDPYAGLGSGGMIP